VAGTLSITGTPYVDVCLQRQRGLLGRQLVYREEGTHEGVVANVDGDGKMEIVGHRAQITELVRQQAKIPPSSSVGSSVFYIWELSGSRNRRRLPAAAGT
jgi:hypothetical protein